MPDHAAIMIDCSKSEVTQIRQRATLVRRPVSNDILNVGNPKTQVLTPNLGRPLPLSFFAGPEASAQEPFHTP